MKKLIAAGAASAVLAAMPIVGAFADAQIQGSFKDTLIMTVNESCSITRGTTTNGHAAGTGDNSTPTAWGTNSDATEGEAAHVDTLSATVTPGQTYNNLGTSTFKVVCNGPNGYTVTAASNTSGTLTAPGALTHSVAAVNTASPWNYNAGGTVSSTTNSQWSIGSSSSNKDLANNIVSQNADGTPSTTDDTFTVTYMAAVKDGQPSGNYTTSVNYVLTRL